MGLRADALGASGRIPEAEQLYQQAIELTQTLYGDLDSHTAQIQVAFARFLAQQGRKIAAAQRCSLAVEIYDTGAVADPIALRGALEPCGICSTNLAVGLKCCRWRGGHGR